MSNAHDTHGPDRYARHYVPERPPRPVNRDVVRQVLVGGAVVVGLAVGIQALAFLADLRWELGSVMILQSLIEVARAVIFSAAAALTGIYLAPPLRTLDLRRLFGRLLVGGGVGTAALLGFTVALMAPSGVQLIDMMLHGGVLQALITGITNTALFALGVMIVRSLPEYPQPASLLLESGSPGDPVRSGPVPRT